MQLSLFVFDIYRDNSNTRQLPYEIKQQHFKDTQRRRTFIGFKNILSFWFLFFILSLE